MLTQLLNNPANILPASILDFPSQVFVLLFILVFVAVGTGIVVLVTRTVEWLWRGKSIERRK